MPDYTTVPHSYTRDALLVCVICTLRKILVHREFEGIICNQEYVHRQHRGKTIPQLQFHVMKFVFIFLYCTCRSFPLEEIAPIRNIRQLNCLGVEVVSLSLLLVLLGVLAVVRDVVPCLEITALLNQFFDFLLNLSQLNFLVLVLQ